MITDRPTAMAREGEPPRDDGYFGPSSVTWRVGAAPAGAVGAGAAALSQMLLPRVAYMIDQRSSFYTDPETRARLTGDWGATTYFGDRSQADRANQLLRTIHRAKIATDPTTGDQYHADEPDLQVYVLNTISYFVLRALGRWGPSLTPDEKDRYVAEQRITGELLGIPTCELLPGSVAELKAYMGSMKPKLAYTDEAGRIRDAMLREPAKPTMPRAIHQLMADAMVSLLTPQMRNLYGFRWSRLRHLVVSLEAWALFQLAAADRPYARAVPQMREYVMTHAFGGKVRSAKPASPEQIAKATADA